MSEYSPVSSEARAIRKGLPTMLVNSVQRNIKRKHAAPVMTKSRAVNYRNMIADIMDTYAGMVILRTVFQRKTRKQEITRIICLDGTTGDLQMLGIEVTFKDPQAADIGTMPITITRHAIERLAQRDKNRYLDGLADVYHFWEERPEPGTYEIGCKTGMFIVNVIDDEFRSATAITYIDASKLRPEQPCSSGATRRIDNTPGSRI